MAAATTRTLLAVLVATVLVALPGGLVQPGVAGVSDRMVVQCYDDARGLVSRTLRGNCRGEVVGEDRAAEIRSARDDRIREVLNAPATEPATARAAGRAAPSPGRSAAENGQTGRDRPAAPPGGGAARTPGAVVAAAAPAPASFTGPGSLSVPITVRETAGVGASDYPTTVVVPLPFGHYHDTDRFTLRDDGGAIVPAQFAPLNRWTVHDDSIRHLVVQFNATVPPFDRAGTGIAQYRLGDDGGDRPPTALEVRDGSETITVVTGPLKFTVNKSHFTIIDEAWFDRNGDGVFDDDERVIAPGADQGGVLVGRLPGDVQRGSDRRDLRIEIEEEGPLRAVIRASAPTRYAGPDDHTHGFAVRIYAYAGLPLVKIDYQLQNSSKDKRYAWPLYFQDMAVRLQLDLDDDPTVRFGTGGGEVFERRRGDGIHLAQERHDRFAIHGDGGSAPLREGTAAEGYVDIHDGRLGVTAMTRYFWEMWPNGLAVDGDNTLSFQLFPAWSAQWYDGEISPTGLHWLWDMQHAYKEMLLHFHDGSVDAGQLSRLAATFDYHPVAVVPRSWYQETGVTIPRFGGKFAGGPTEASAGPPRPQYRARDEDPTDRSYLFNWVNFRGVDFNRRTRPCTTGSWPSSAAHFLLSGDPNDYFVGAQQAMGALNHRPQWIADYRHDRDWERLQLNDAPYCGGSWRAFEGHGVTPLDAPPLEGTGRDWSARDNPHGWHHHIEESYYYTANPWVRDWYEFIGEFRKSALLRVNPFPDNASRGIGHMLANALQAYRVTGDRELFRIIGQVFIATKTPAERVHPYYGYAESGGFSLGYLMHGLADYLAEAKDGDHQGFAAAFNVLAAYVDWNYYFGNFAHSFHAEDEAGKRGVSGGTGLTLVDPQAWYFWNTGKHRYLDHLEEYLGGGVNGGRRPYGKFDHWSGQYENRFYHYVRATPRDLDPPAPITDLAARAGSAGVTLEWTTPAEAERFHVVWSDRPISAEPSRDDGMIVWWAATPVGPKLAAAPGKKQSLDIAAATDDTVYAAIFSFDAGGNMSAISNIAATSGAVIDPPEPPSAPQG